MEDRSTLNVSHQVRPPPHHHLMERARQLAEQRRSLRLLTERIGDDDAPSRGGRAADAFARAVGSWRFIGIQSGLLLVWVAVNSLAWAGHWDPYPFILLNLMLSFQAAYAAPIIMMSQNRAAARDRLVAQRDFDVNQRAALEVDEVRTLLQAQIILLEELHQGQPSRSPRPEIAETDVRDGSAVQC